MELGLTVTVCWGDDDLIECRIEASNGAFCGTANVYAGHDRPGEWADAIRGFPTDAMDSRLIECGAPKGGYAGGRARLRFHCIDQAGHAALEVLLVSGWTTTDEAVENVKLTVPISAAAVDAFERDLRTLSLDGKRTARLCEPS